ncbi:MULTISPECIES: Pycsar system effector family protein [Cytobacillus]|uniref:DUF5706 domain-containing protein n=2 Tax=Cytobacillus TaxID=2675230 RepID=A0AA46PN13_CYTFI|nr:MULTISPECIES: Pycsar system effector family protein [Cytobacillus]AND43191.1 hypothetical protein A361_28945 [Cytobacillus oceanisediminis 2691]USK47262.1 DUF5706 domain-containing protein [Cytobacillus oceanisediminis]UYG98293.1 DUF5706 domain-containing protein [Cytobacillus firmus]
MLSKEDLELEYQRIAFWINNMDTKISFALGATGVLIGFIFSNEDFSKTLENHSKTLQLWNESSIKSAVFFVLFGLTIILLVAAMWCFLNGLKAKINPRKYKQPHMVSSSNIFWGDISKHNYFSYKYRMDNSESNDWVKDMQTQIYINSCICAQKAKFYNIGIFCLKSALIGFLIYHIWMWFFL